MIKINHLYCKFPFRLTPKNTNLKLDSGRTKIIMRRGPFTGTLSLVSYLNNLISISLISLLSGFWNHFIINLFCSNTLVILVLFLRIIWITEFTRPVYTIALCTSYALMCSMR